MVKNKLQKYGSRIKNTFKGQIYIKKLNIKFPKIFLISFSLLIVISVFLGFLVKNSDQLETTVDTSSQTEIKQEESLDQTVNQETPTSIKKTTSSPSVTKTITPTNKLSENSTHTPSTSTLNPTQTGTITTATPTQAASQNPTATVTSSKPRGAKLSPNEAFSVEGNFINLPKTGEKGCNSDNKVQVELIYNGTLFNPTSTNFYGYPWVLQAVGEPKDYLGYVPCGGSAKISVNFTAKDYPDTSQKPYVTAAIAEFGTPNSLSVDRYEFSW